MSDCGCGVIPCVDQVMGTGIWQSAAAPIVGPATSIRLYCSAAGSPSGSWRVRIEGDRGVPDGIEAYSSGFLSVQALAGDMQPLDFPITLPAGRYQVIVETDETYKTSVTESSYMSVKGCNSTISPSLFDGTQWTNVSVGILVEKT